MPSTNQTKVEKKVWRHKNTKYRHCWENSKRRITGS